MSRTEPFHNSYYKLKNRQTNKNKQTCKQKQNQKKNNQTKNCILPAIPASEVNQIFRNFFASLITGPIYVQHLQNWNNSKFYDFMNRVVYRCTFVLFFYLQLLLQTYMEPAITFLLFY